MFLSLKIDFVEANCADPNEMPYHVTYHPDLHCLGVLSPQMNKKF